MTDSDLQQRIARQRARLGLRPWELAPAEVDDHGCPWPVGTAGYDSWQKALALRDRWRAARAAGRPDLADDGEDVGE